MHSICTDNDIICEMFLEYCCHSFLINADYEQEGPTSLVEGTADL